MNIKPFIGLRAKMLLALMLGMILLFALVFFVARTVLLDGYSKLEKDKTNIQINSAISLLKEQSDQLSTNVRDYAHWDDMYQFVVKKDPAFIKASLTDTVFTNFKINALFVINNEGEAVFQRGVNHTTLKPWHIPELIIQATRKGGALTNPSKTNTSGLFWTPQGIFVVAAIDIVNSEESKPRRGTLIMVRQLDQALLDHMQEILSTKISVDALRDEEIADLSPHLTKGEKVVMPLINNQVGGFALIDAISGQYNKLVLSTAGDRKIFEQGQSSLKLLYWASLLAALLLGAFSWLFDKLVLTRLAHLNQNVKRIGDSASTSERVKDFSGNDEMAGLAQGINGMLERLNETQYALQFEKERAQVTLSSIADAVITSNNKNCVVYMNTAAERLTGVNANYASGKPLHWLFNLMSEDKTTPIDSTWLIDSTSKQDEVTLERADGQAFIISKSASPLYDASGLQFGTVTVLHDVTMLRALSQQLSYQARYDALTGLINRYEFDCKAQAAIEDSYNDNRVHCLAYIDLDKFKIVNDTCGHAAGDLLLKQLADHLKSKVRSSDSLARLGGDEFALLLMGCSLDKAHEIVKSLLQAVQDFHFSFEDKVFKVGASIGLIDIKPDQNHTLGDLLSKVDSACYAAKGDGGNRIHIYRADDRHIENRNSQMQWVSRINTALAHKNFVLYMQSLAGLNMNDEQHCELLIRMHGEDGKLYPPGSFLPIAERYHIMPQIDRWVISEALAIMARKGAQFKTVCAINLSGQSLSQEGFLDFVINQIKQHKVDAKQLCFEITETAVITNLNKARQFMHALRAIGCRFSLDDFGSGMSSFAYLKNLEVDFLKIDGMFVKTIVNNKIDRAMVESINKIGHVMGLKTIAEFAENQETIDMLQEIGVDYAQGYGVKMPKLFE
jgi:diguanylate cyclase (GGDEF)-like protein/PAS domain S-box-containing protein